MNGIIKPRVINTTPRTCAKPVIEVTIPTPVVEIVNPAPVIAEITQVETFIKKKQNIKPQSGKINE